MIKANDDPLDTKANAAFDEAAREVLARAQAAKTEIVVWREGQSYSSRPIKPSASYQNRLRTLELNQRNGKSQVA